MYNQAIPENSKATYTEFDTVDFQMLFQNESLKLGSCRLLGNVRIKKGGVNMTDNNIITDKFVGAHSFIESIQTEMLGQVFENQTEYGRMVKQYSVARNNHGDLFNSSNVCELKSPVDDLTNAVLKGETLGNTNDPVDFSVKLDFILNSNAVPMPYSKSGPIKVSLNLARVNSALYGYGMDTTVTYELSNLRLAYETTTAPNPDPIILRKKMHIKSSIQSSLANVQTKVPATDVESMFISFQVQANENTPKNNNLTLDKLPAVEEVQLLFNDNTGAGITFQLKDNESIISNYLMALSSDGRNNLSTNNMYSNDGYGIGYKMPTPIDLSNQKISVQINSGVSNSKPYVMYMCFQSLVSF